MHDPQLIYDIGAHDGADTWSYLQQGYRVVAVDASPLMVETLFRRFAGELERGLLTIVPAAVTETDGETVSFYVSSNDYRSSLERGIAESDGTPSTAVTVKGRSLPSLFAAFGLPFYCKIDIEGGDAAAIRSMLTDPRRPVYLSCECCGASIAAVHADPALLYSALDALQQAGYTQFKLVDQEQMIVLDDRKYYSRLHGILWRCRTKLEQWTGCYSRKYNNRRYLIEKGSLPGGDISGFWGDALPGEWTSHAQTRRRLESHFRDYFDHTQNKQLIFWVDIHARQ